MTKLSEKLANASVEDAPKLITKLAILNWGDVHDIQVDIDTDCLTKWTNFKALVAIGPEGWLSAVMMLVPDGDTEYAVYRIGYDNKLCPAAWVGDSSNEVLHGHPALALASAIAEKMENDDE